MVLFRQNTIGNSVSQEENIVLKQQHTTDCSSGVGPVSYLCACAIKKTGEEEAVFETLFPILLQAGQSHRAVLHAPL
jgi:hypothetical protein